MGNKSFLFPCSPQYLESVIMCTFLNRTPPDFLLLFNSTEAYQLSGCKYAIISEKLTVPQFIEPNHTRLSSVVRSIETDAQPLSRVQLDPEPSPTMRRSHSFGCIFSRISSSSRVSFEAFVFVFDLFKFFFPFLDCRQCVC